MRRCFSLFIISCVLCISPAKAQVQSHCVGRKDFQTDIKIILNTPDPIFNFKKSARELTSGNREKILKEWATTKEKRAWIEQGHVAGLARGGSGVYTKAYFVGAPYGRRTGYYCPYFKTLEIEIYYSSVIFVAKDYKEGSCDFSVILEHEFRHHDTNHRIVTEYAKRLEKDLPEMIAHIENYGYVYHDKVNARFELMQQSISDALDIYGDEIHKAMVRDNGEIDTLENYQKESMICAGKR